jgi:hypothetical protein
MGAICSIDCSKKVFEDTIYFNTASNILIDNEERIKEMIQVDKNLKWEKCYLINKENIMENFNFDVKYKILNKIKIPIKFYIIKEDFYYSISEKGMENKKRPFLISSFKGYIIIRSNENNNILFVCSLKGRYHFEVDYIFVFFIYQDNNNYRISEIFEKKDLKNEQSDKLIYFKGEFDDTIGFYFKCNNDNDYRNIKPPLKSIIDIEEKIENSLLYDIYKSFMNSINSMENIPLINITTDEIDKYIKHDKSLSIFLFDYKIFEKFLKGILLDSEQNDQISFLNTENSKKELINVDNNYSLYLFHNIILNFSILNKKEHISLITEKMFLPEKIKCIKDKLVHLLLINNKYYLYFKTENKILNIKKSIDSNN